MVNKITCSFCGIDNNEQEAKVYTKGIGEIYICQECVKECAKLLQRNNVDLDLDYKLDKPKEQIQNNKIDKNSILGKKPFEIKKELDKFIIGQEEAKKILSVEICNHYKRFNQKEIKILPKNNIVLVGKSGTGKTYLIQKISELFNINLFIADATEYTENGYSGKDVDKIIVGLYNKCNGDIKQVEKGIIYIDEIDKISKKISNNGRDATGEGVQDSLLKMIEGTEIQINVGSLTSPKQVNINTSNILFIFGGAFSGIDDIVKKRLNQKKSNIGFMKDELKKEIEIDTDLSISTNDLIEFGMKQEFIGRTPLIAKLNNLSETDLFEILTKSEGNIIEQYKNLLKIDDVELDFTEEAVKYIVNIAMQKNIGARGLKGIISKKMNNFLYNIEDYKESKIEITENILKEC